MRGMVPTSERPVPAHRPGLRGSVGAACGRPHVNGTLPGPVRRARRPGAPSPAAAPNPAAGRGRPALRSRGTRIGAHIVRPHGYAVGTVGRAATGRPYGGITGVCVGEVRPAGRMVRLRRRRRLGLLGGDWERSHRLAPALAARGLRALRSALGRQGDSARCGGRPEGSALWTPAAFEKAGETFVRTLP